MAYVTDFDVANPSKPFERLETIFKPIMLMCDSAESAYDAAWLKLIDYKGIDALEVTALENVLASTYEAWEASKRAWDSTYYALPK